MPTAAARLPPNATGWEKALWGVDAGGSAGDGSAELPRMGTAGDPIAVCTSVPVQSASGSPPSLLCAQIDLGSQAGGRDEPDHKTMRGRGEQQCPPVSAQAILGVGLMGRSGIASRCSVDLDIMGGPYRVIHFTRLRF
ncbi:hypothetical protein DL771_005449 [Monosporascus sp. 5C6A]|nr:hypothetical protein DL771_005449 [Monosporascus sp. 5C6A]